MNIPKFLKDKLFPELGRMVRDNIKKQIRADLFSAAPFGKPLADSTIQRRKKRGNASKTALLDTGLFRGGMNYTAISNGVKISSNGRPKDMQEKFVHGTATIPERNPFVKDLPLKGTNRTIELAVQMKSAIEIVKYCDREISKIKGVT